MNLDKLNHWLSLGANIGVLAGIIFLVFELQQNTRATQLEVASNFQNSFTNIELLIASNPEFADMLIRGREGGELSAEEQFRLGVFLNNILRQWQFVQFQYISDALDEDIWLGQRAYFTWIIQTDKFLYDHWQSTRNYYSPRFNALVEEMAEGR